MSKKSLHTKELVEAVGALVVHQGSLNPMPVGNMVMHFVCPDIGGQATRTAAWAAKHTRQSNLASTLERDWKHKNRLIRYVDQPRLDQGPKPTLCYKFGFCVCTERGKQVLTLQNKILKVLKLECKNDSPSRELLSSACLVVRLQFERARAHGSAWGALAFGESGKASDGQEADSGSVWAHLGFHSFSPYRPPMHLLDELPPPPNNPYLRVRATFKYKRT